MPSKRGWATIAAGLTLIATGRLFAIREAWELGAVLLLLFAICWMSLFRDKPIISGRRQLSSSRVHLGSEIEVRIVVTNRGARRVNSLWLKEEAPDGTVSMQLADIGKGRSTSTSYRIRPSARGIHTLGPARIYIEDPFRLARRTFMTIEADRAIVYPAIGAVELTKLQPQATAHGVVRAPAPAAAGADFFTIREHQYGDDPRKVHWVSSARFRKLMIRQEEQHRQNTVSIVVVGQEGRDERESFETALSSAASIADAYLRRGALVDLAVSGSDLPGTGRGKGTEHRHKIMEKLALAAIPRTRASLVSTIDRTAIPDEVVAVTDCVPGPDFAQVLRMVPKLTVVITTEQPDAVDAARALERMGADVVFRGPAEVQASYDRVGAR